MKQPCLLQDKETSEPRNGSGDVVSGSCMRDGESEATKERSQIDEKACQRNHCHGRFPARKELPNGQCIVEDCIGASDLGEVLHY